MKTRTKISTMFALILAFSAHGNAKGNFIATELVSADDAGPKKMIINLTNKERSKKSSALSDFISTEFKDLDLGQITPNEIMEISSEYKDGFSKQTFLVALSGLPKAKDSEGNMVNKGFLIASVAGQDGSDKKTVNLERILGSELASSADIVSLTSKGAKGSIIIQGKTAEMIYEKIDKKVSPIQASRDKDRSMSIESKTLNNFTCRKTTRSSPKSDIAVSAFTCIGE